MQVMKERDDSRSLSGIIQLDDVYRGGECRGGKRGRGSPDKMPFIAAVPVDSQGHPIAMNMTVVKGFRTSEISRWAKRHLNVDAHVISDGLACFSAVTSAGCQHTSIITGGGPECVTREEFTWINTSIGNVKKSINGAYHAINPKHLPRYLAEFCYRFNRRFKLEDMLLRFAYVAARTPPMPMRLLRLAEDYRLWVIRKIFEEFPHVKKRYWGRHFWARGYFCVTAGELTKQMIEEYLEHHSEAKDNPNFEIEE